LNQSPARSDAWLSAGDPRWCAVVAVCKDLLGGSDERQKSYLCTCKLAEQLDQSPAHSDAWLSVGDPRWCAVVAVCKDHLGGSDERQKSYLCTCKLAAQLDQSPARSGAWLSAGNGSLQDISRCGCMDHTNRVGHSRTLVNAAAWTTQTGVGHSRTAAVVCMEGRSQGPESTRSTDSTDGTCYACWTCCNTCYCMLTKRRRIVIELL
jgi:hypothetical protein